MGDTNGNVGDTNDNVGDIVVQEHDFPSLSPLSLGLSNMISPSLFNMSKMAIDITSDEKFSITFDVLKEKNYTPLDIAEELENHDTFSSYIEKILTEGMDSDLIDSEKNYLDYEESFEKIITSLKLLENMVPLVTKIARKFIISLFKEDSFKDIPREDYPLFFKKFMNFFQCINIDFISILTQEHLIINSTKEFVYEKIEEIFEDEDQVESMIICMEEIDEYVHYLKEKEQSENSNDESED